jgi:hypothetical protein
MVRTTISSEYRKAGMWSRVRSTAKHLDGDARGIPTLWVARITSIGGKHGLEREFIDPVVDYSNANKSGNRGVMMYWHVEDGIYETCLGSRHDRGFCRVEGGWIIDCTKEEAIAWLSKCLG